MKGLVKTLMYSSKILHRLLILRIIIHLITGIFIFYALIPNCHVLKAVLNLNLLKKIWHLQSNYGR